MTTSDWDELSPGTTLICSLQSVMRSYESTMMIFSFNGENRRYHDRPLMESKIGSIHMSFGGS